MCCLFGIIGFFFPRLAIVVLALTTHYLQTAYHALLWPLLGFFFAPFTTLAYAFAINEHGSLSGWYVGLFVLAVLMDLGVVGSGARARRAKRSNDSR